MQKLPILPILLIIVTLLDIATTHYAISIGLQEGNPLSQQIMKWWFVLLKILLSVVCVVCLQIAIPYFKWLRFIYIIPILPLLIAVINNVIQISIQLKDRRVL